MSNKYREIGEVLAAARRDQHKSLKDAAESTKIMKQYLEALEAGLPDKLPSYAYFRLFARSYAQYLGLDPSLFVEIEEKDMASAASSSDDTKSVAFDIETGETVSKEQAKKFGRSLIYLASAIIVIFIGFIGYSQLFVGNGNESGQDESETSAGEIHSPADNEPNQVELNVPDDPYEPAGKLKMHMMVNQEVWAMVVRDGDTVLNRRLNPGEERRWEADYRYHLTLGISTAVDLYVNDLKLAPLTERAQTISGLEINQVNYEDFLPSNLEASPTENLNDNPVDLTGEESADGN
jgi:transcriptional regulator with XRE-family HTH domain